MKWREFFFWMVLIIRALAAIIIGGVGYVLHIIGGAMLYVGSYIAGPALERLFSSGESEVKAG